MILIFRQYFKGTECSAGDTNSDQFFVIPSSKCMAVTDGKSVKSTASGMQTAVKSQQFTECGNGRYTITQYSDENCSVWAMAVAQLLPTCADSDPSSDSIMTSMTCSTGSKN
jgi:hypothetical protein